MTSSKSLGVGPHWHVEDADLYRVFEALTGLMPEGSLVGLQPGSWPRELRAFLDARGVEPGASIRDSIPNDFDRARFLPTDEETMASFTELARGCAEPEIAVHLIALHDGRCLLEWYDIPEDAVLVATSIDEARIARFARDVDGGYEFADGCCA